MQTIFFFKLEIKYTEISHATHNISSYLQGTKQIIFILLVCLGHILWIYMAIHDTRERSLIVAGIRWYFLYFAEK